MIKITSIGLGLLVSSLASGQTLEERVAALEKRVAELEAQKENAAAVSGGSETPSKKGVIFQAGFEKGVTGWVEEMRYMQPENMNGVSKPTLQIHSWEKFRTAKELKTSKGIIKPQEGKRFLTLASQEKGVVIVNSKANVAHNVVRDWRAVHYVSTKEAISLAELNLPMVSAMINLQCPAAEIKNHGLGVCSSSATILKEVTSTHSKL